MDAPDDPDDDLDDAIRDLEATAADWRDDATAFRALARRWYDNAGADGTRPDAATRLTLLGDRAMRRAGEVEAEESTRLVALNSALIRSGLEAGSARDLGGSRYLVAAEGGPCVRTGPAVPEDGRGPDPEWTDRDEMYDRMAEYAQMVRVGPP